MAKIVHEGCVHGRFQPPHNEHIEYILAAKQLCGFLWIGLAQPDIVSLSECVEAPHRASIANNPLTFYERSKIITDSLTDLGVPRSEFGFIPFPIESPSHIKQYISETTTCYTTICEDWGRHKVGILNSLGLKVEVLWEREKQIEGRQIRDSISAKDDSWRKLVPRACSRFIDDHVILERILRNSLLQH